MKNMHNFTNNIDSYDKGSNFYYKSISDEHRKSHDEKSMFSKIKQLPLKIVNLAIIDSKDNGCRLLFDKSQEVEIRFVLFEQEYNEEEKKIEFNDKHLYVRNNENIEQRVIKNKFLIGLNINENIELWTADKNGLNLKKMLSLNKDEQWHLDVKNSKIRVLSSVNSTFSMQIFEW